MIYSYLILFYVPSTILHLGPTSGNEGKNAKAAIKFIDMGRSPFLWQYNHNFLSRGVHESKGYLKYLRNLGQGMMIVDSLNYSPKLLMMQDEKTKNSA